MRFARSVRVPVPAAALFAWHERPGAFQRLAPPWQRVRVRRTDGRVTDGARVELEAHVAPHPALDPLVELVVPPRWVVEHRDHVPGRQFRDVQLEGPFARWSHLHRVEPDGDAASVLTDEVDLALPLGPLGALGAPVARAELARLFRYRHAVTAADLERHAAAALPPLTVAVTGASGLVGSALVPFLTAGGHTVVRIGRGAPRDAGTPQLRDVRWDPDAGTLDPRALEGVDAVVHLAGASVSERWTDAHRRAIEESRVRGTTLLAGTLARLERPPRVLVSASAVGLYGDRGDEVLDEHSAPGTGFLADVARRWEASTDAAARAGIRVVHARLGVVLTPAGGALPKLMLPFRLGAGGRLGDGRQWMSLVALDDVVGALHFAIAHDALRGPVNVVSPEPMTNADFTRVLGRVLHRPSFAAAPAFALRLALGAEFADAMLLASQRAVPRALLAAGFRFRHPTVEGAVRHELGKGEYE
ncbi:TIGR01777 family oxidoreductase [Roseisolibacter sp. H3M3-2]|uniref:TIGR01777 family oxidoreductase n=1 Tax=Roseisolibacter sp. H3M3-2 TaxID=3031323 RepID=UPI0023DB5949|nr:TIGR01777 family oxidoreductase [Roseisolibacter sp. H3M3-2]MDF1503001.1 TIGR01777 family oxidoreductase [Roseisolibacter sp. H3M3-2]